MKIFKKSLLVCLILLFSVFAILPVCADDFDSDKGGYVIKDYHFSGVYKKNNSVEVTEKLLVDFAQPRHGIYRTLPLTMMVKRTIKKGETAVLDYQNEVKDVNVINENFNLDDDGDYLNIIIGDEDNYVNGEKEYTIKYTYVMPDDRVKGNDLIYYSVLGSEWQAPIDKFTFDVKFEKPLTDEEVNRFVLNSGQYGSVGNNLDVDYKVTKEGIKGVATNIQPQSAITIYDEVREGYFEGAKKLSNTIPLTLLVAAGVVALFLLIYELVKKQKKPVVTVEFYPPNGMSSAEVGTAIDEIADDIDLVSLIPWWANEGYITIEEVPDKKGRTGDHGSLILHKIKDLPIDSPSYQKQLFNALFTSKDIDLDNLPTSFSKDFSSAKSQLGKVFTGEKTLSKGRGLANFIVFVMCGALFGAIATSSEVSLSWNVVPAAVSAIAMFVFGFFRIKTVTQDAVRPKKKWAMYIILGLILLAISGGAMFMAAKSQNFFHIAYWAALFVLIVISILFVGRIITPTDYKLELAGKLLGLKQFIETAELDKLKMLVDENPTYFFDVLPYAMVFGLSDHWAKQFKGLTIKQPDWYICYDMMLFNSLYFNRMLYRNINQPISHLRTEAMMQQAASAASKGFSGGGGGGGGGGSW